MVVMLRVTDFDDFAKKKKVKKILLNFYGKIMVCKMFCVKDKIYEKLIIKYFITNLSKWDN